MTPDNVFRFLNVRPAQRIGPNARPYARFGAGRSPLHVKIAQLAPDVAREASIELATDFLRSDAHIAEQDPTLVKVAQALEGKATAALMREAALEVLGSSLPTWLGTDAARLLKNRVWDGVYAQGIAPAARPDSREVTYWSARVLFTLEKLAGLSVAEGELPSAAVTPRGLVIPPDLLQKTGKRDLDLRRDEELFALQAAIARTNKLAGDLQTAAKELRQGERVLRDERSHGAPRPLSELRSSPLTEAVSTPSSRPRSSSSRSTASRSRSRSGPALAPIETTVQVPRSLPVHRSERARELLSETTLRLLAERDLAVRPLSAAKAAAALESEAYEAAKHLIAAIPRAAVAAVAGDANLVQLAERTKFRLPFQIDVIKIRLPPTPVSRGIRPLGIGDLMVVKQQLVKYEAGEIAHVENVMESERRSRLHKRQRETEETVVTEVEELEESEKSLQTTERFELHKEAQKTIESTMKFDAGVSLSAGYGPVMLTAHADFALTNATSESTKTASDFAKEITEKSVSRIQQRTREERTRRTLERFEEINEHGFDNTEGKGHIIGVYRWLDKHYRARVVNYGRRLMIEFIVPEPAAYYLHVTNNRPLAGVTMPRPTPPELNGAALCPSDLTQDNYREFVAQYGIQDVEPYPETEIKVGAALVAKKPAGLEGDIVFAEATEKIVVPPGYQAWDVYGRYNVGGEESYWAEVKIAGQDWGSVTANGLEGPIPCSVIGWGTVLHVNVVARCEPTQQLVERWQNKTFTAIVGAYQRALAAYNEQVVAAQIQQGVAIEGRNPELNRKLERDELRKLALQMLTDDFAFLVVSGQRLFNHQFHGMPGVDSYGYPAFLPATALLDGKIIQFFEQAFEWNNLTYRFYPYFWGRKSGWTDHYRLTDPDPLFTDFLRAGAARVVVPVHPAYTETVLYYLHTGEIWNGGEPPTIDDPLFVSIVEEMRGDASITDTGENLERCSLDGRIPCVVDEWDVKVPTTLVILQKDDELNPLPT